MKNLALRLALSFGVTVALVSCGQALEPTSQLSKKNDDRDGKGKTKKEPKPVDESAGMNCKVVSVNHKVCTDADGNKWDCTRGSTPQCVPEGEI